MSMTPTAFSFVGMSQAFWASFRASLCIASYSFLILLIHTVTLQEAAAAPEIQGPLHDHMAPEKAKKTLSLRSSLSSLISFPSRWLRRVFWDGPMYRWQERILSVSSKLVPGARTVPIAVVLGTACDHYRSLPTRVLCQRLYAAAVLLDDHLEQNEKLASQLSGTDRKHSESLFLVFSGGLDSGCYPDSFPTEADIMEQYFKERLLPKFPRVNQAFVEENLTIFKENNSTSTRSNALMSMQLIQEDVLAELEGQLPPNMHVEVNVVNQASTNSAPSSPSAKPTATASAPPPRPPPPLSRSASKLPRAVSATWTAHGGG
eukprot:CAMPEP_0181306686 /NCGR_PEP_ID=MMETSP1101-20121128/10445_1 /TAXON_ID=46948 /ORGANISM="Rhodomonas abbreviata, Strain Caron Lab Isolate" /LENGTH=317 /DNA_ID=CAMNT_0023412785 /DNA_START=153 /DNA_END=1106 /DNA_ORIENTATION=+